MKKRIYQKTLSLALSFIMTVVCLFGVYVIVSAEGEAVESLTFAGWSLTLQNDLSLNYAVDAKYFTEYGYEEPEVTFVMGERTVTVTEFDTNRYPGYYIFTLTDIAPHKLGETVTATMSATYGEERVTTKAQDYSVKQYCYNTLSNTNNNALKTLIVDLLNYGAATQTYAGSSDPLVNAELTDAQKAFGTQTDVTLNSKTNFKYQTVTDPSVSWLGAYLTLTDTVEMKFVFNVEETDGLKAKISTKDPLNKEASGTDYYVTEFDIYKDGGYVAAFDRFDAARMREVVCVTVLDSENKAVSNTYAYSIESYAYAKQNDENESLAELVKAMMKYGDSAKIYSLQGGINLRVDYRYHWTSCGECECEINKEEHSLVGGVCSVCKAEVIEKEDGWTVEYVKNGEKHITVDAYDKDGNFIRSSLRLVFEGYAPDSDDSEFGDYSY